MGAKREVCAFNEGGWQMEQFLCYCAGGIIGIKLANRIIPSQQYSLSWGCTTCTLHIFIQAIAFPAQFFPFSDWQDGETVKSKHKMYGTGVLILFHNSLFWKEMIMRQWCGVWGRQRFVSGIICPAIFPRHNLDNSVSEWVWTKWSAGERRQ